MAKKSSKTEAGVGNGGGERIYVVYARKAKITVKPVGGFPRYF